MALEGNFNGPVIITSTQGGSNIEEIAEENPDAIIRHPINITTGLRREDALSIGERLGFRNGALEEVCLSLLSDSFVELTFLFSLGRGHDVEVIQSVHGKRCSSPRNQSIH